MTTVIVQRPGSAVDEYGNTQPSWASPTETTVTLLVPPAPVQAAELKEITDRRQGATHGFYLFAPLTPEVHPEDRVVIDGDTFEVDGVPDRWPAGQQVTVVRAV